MGDYEDVISGVDFLIAKGMVDKDRVGSVGCIGGRRHIDWMTYYGNTDIHPFTRQYLKGTPWDDAEIYRKTSPITYVNRVRTPTLIQHGDQDKRVPPLLYRGFGNPINKPKQQRAVMEHNYEWFSKYIWGEEVPAQPPGSGGNY